MSVICNFEVLSDHECRRLLASHDVGRVAFMGDDGYPVMVPVNYVIEGDTIVFRTAPSGGITSSATQPTSSQYGDVDE